MEDSVSQSLSQIFKSLLNGQLAFIYHLLYIVIGLLRYLNGFKKSIPSAALN